jgi:hypothetical protein
MVQVPRIARNTTIERYDPFEAPDRRQWLALDEAERIDLVEDYHRDAGIHVPDLKLHATLHAIVENQIALGDELPVERTLRRLMAEGLDRHDALHAMSMELIMHVRDLVHQDEAPADTNQPYFDALERLTAEGWRRSADEEGDERTAVERIFEGLAAGGRPALEAIRDARAQRAVTAPAFVQAIERYLAGDSNPVEEDALVLAFHLLAEWNEKSAYRPLAKLLRRPSDEIECLLGIAITETSHRVMAAVFDGDPQPLYDIILDRNADEFARARMCEALAMLASWGELPRDEAARFLDACFSNLEPKAECFVWEGWQSAISMLGLVELETAVEQVFKLGYIDSSTMSFDDFKGDLQRAIDGSGLAPWYLEGEFDPFGDTLEELSHWQILQPDDGGRTDDDPFDSDPPMPTRVPAVNPFKGIGRNDPCPCGRGKKFKKCCLNSTA